ncbi:MAG: phosphatase PAP2 family protein [Dysgonomonas sp.]|nr:phosphatase PAP2 family protein [Dysgonomonas sp.]
MEILIVILQISFPEWDRELFMYLNSKNVEWLNPVMSFLSAYISWALVCLGIILFIIYKDRMKGTAASFFLLLGVGINSLVNNLIKVMFMRPRPGNEPLLDEIIHQLEDAGTSYSFFSAHSSNSICLALFTTLYFRNKYYGIFIFAWAFTVAYSRIYVGKHYPLDVICGILFGFFTGWFGFWLYKNYDKRKNGLLENEDKLQ